MLFPIKKKLLQNAVRDYNLNSKLRAVLNFSSGPTFRLNNYDMSTSYILTPRKFIYCLLKSHV